MDKIDVLIEENEDAQMARALQAHGMTAKRKKELQDSTAKMKSAAKSGLQMGGLVGAASAIGGGLSGGPLGALASGGLMGTLVGVASGANAYRNIKKIVDMPPKDVKKYVKEAETKWGKELTKAMIEAGGTI